MEHLIEKQYSGDRSKYIWDLIKSLPENRHEEMYACFVLLQNMESTCITWLQNALGGVMKCKCGFKFAGPGEFRNCDAFIDENGQSGVICPECNQAYVNGEPVKLEKDEE